MKQHSKKGERPLPFRLSISMAFIPDNLDEAAYREEVRRIVRAELPSPSLSAMNDVHLFEEYDDCVDAIIKEELTRN